MGLSPDDRASRLLEGDLSKSSSVSAAAGDSFLDSAEETVEEERSTLLQNDLARRRESVFDFVRSTADFSGSLLEESAPSQGDKPSWLQDMGTQSFLLLTFHSGEYVLG